MRLQKDVDILMLWMRGSQLTINASKSKCMTICPTVRASRRRSEPYPPIKMAEVTLEEVSVYKYLGLYIDSELNFKTHMNMITKNVAHKIYLLAKLKPSLNERGAIIIFKSMILPLFDTGELFYLSASQGLLDGLRILQNRALRIACGLPPRTNTDQLLVKLNLLPLKKRRILHLLQLARWLAGREENLDQRIISTRMHGRDRKILKVMNPKCDKVTNSFIYRCATLWNSLPTEYHAEMTDDKFKIMLRKTVAEGEGRLSAALGGRAGWRERPNDLKTRSVVYRLVDYEPV